MVGRTRLSHHRYMHGNCAAVVFDHYFTLADPDATTERELAPLVARLLPGLTYAEFRRRAAAASVIKPAAERSTAVFESYWTRWVCYGEALFRTLGVFGAGEAFAAARYRAHATAPVYPDVAASIRRLRSAGLRIGIASNADTGYLMENIRLNGVAVDAVVSSEEVACYKPEPAVFVEVCRRMHVAPKDVVHVGDDLVADVEGARRVGMRAVWLDRDRRRPVGKNPSAAARIASLPELDALLDLRKTP